MTVNDARFPVGSPDEKELLLQWLGYLREAVIHLINETARHAGHADATRELVDRSTGE